MQFLLKNTSWQSRKKIHKFFCIYHGSPSWLHFSAYLEKLLYTITAKFSKNSWKKLKACSWIFFQRTGLKSICRQWWGQHRALLGLIPALEARAHLGTCTVFCLCSILVQCPSTFSSCSVSWPLPWPVSWYTCHISGRFLDPVLFPNLRQAQPQNKTFSLVPI